MRRPLPQNPPRSPVPIRHTPATEADITFSHAKYQDAIPLYKKDADASGEEGDRAHNALIRSELRSGKVEEADKDASAWGAKSPKDAWAIDAIGEVAFRKGEIDKAGDLMRAALAANFCNAQAHTDYARYLSFTGYPASAKTQLDIAYKLDPIDDEIGGDWTNTQRGADRIKAIKSYMERTKFLTDKERASWQKSLDAAEKSSLYTCKLTSGQSHTTIPMLAMSSHPAPGNDMMETRWGLGVTFNGSLRHLDLDTGASGLVLTKTAAKSLNLQIDSANEIGGFGEGKATKGGIAKVKQLRIGDMIFENCPVEVLDSDAGAGGDGDGLIGSDVFQKFLVTIDFPGRAVKLDPLPKLPNQTSETELSAATAEDAPSDGFHDRYIDPSLASWTKVFRMGHMMIVPVRMNKGPVHLFVVDTGNFTDLLATTAAKEVSKLESAPESMEGLQGEDNHVSVTGPVTLDFAGLRKPSPGLYATNLSKFSNIVEIGGFLGIPTLHQLTIQIDYRDQLMKFTFDPSRVRHCAAGMVIADCY